MEKKKAIIDPIIVPMSSCDECQIPYEETALERARRKAGKRCDRCGYNGPGHYQPVEGTELCPKCYELWVMIRAEAYVNFREEMSGTECANLS